MLPNKKSLTFVALIEATALISSTVFLRFSNLPPEKRSIEYLFYFLIKFFIKHILFTFF